MKKLFIENNYKFYNKKRSKNRNERRLNHSYWEVEKNKKKLGKDNSEIKKINSFKKENPDFIKIVAPEIFSFIKNTNEVVKFIDSLRQLYDAKKNLISKILQLGEAKLQDAV
jgi:aspartate ammonia-lyase